MVEEDARVVVQTDPMLAGRVIGNLLKNAPRSLRQGRPRHDRRASCRRLPDVVEVSITHPTVMTEEVRSQVFHRSFSTKGRERGLGTWSVKLLTERYLGEKVSFTSAMGEGTTFRVRLPGSVSEPPKPTP